MEWRDYPNSNSNSKSKSKLANSNHSNGYSQFDFEELKRRGHIEHRISKLDTLAGIAIKYGVDVADIKKLNGFSTDLQMFALNNLYIPLPGKHPPSPCLADAYETGRQTNHECDAQRDLFDSFQSLRLKSKPRQSVSPAMTSLQGYYGLIKSTDQRPTPEGCEIKVLRERKVQCLEDCQLPIRPHKDSHRKTRSLANFALAENGKVPYVSLKDREAEFSIRKDKLVKRRQNHEDKFSTPARERLLKEDNSKAAHPAITVKGLSLRPAAASRTSSGTGSEGCGSNTEHILGDPHLSDRRSSIRKSPSTPIFWDRDASGSSPLPPVAVTKPLLDGLAYSTSRCKNK